MNSYNDEQIITHLDQRLSELRQEMLEMMNGSTSTHHARRATTSPRGTRSQKQTQPKQRTAQTPRNQEMLEQISRNVAKRAGRNLGKQISATLFNEAGSSPSAFSPQDLFDDILKGMVKHQRNR